MASAWAPRWPGLLLLLRCGVGVEAPALARLAGAARVVLRLAGGARARPLVSVLAWVETEPCRCILIVVVIGQVW